MKEKDKKLAKPNLLREKAEEVFKTIHAQKDGHYKEIDLLKLIHELEVHQIELEMQNEELNHTIARAETAEAKYEDLYNFAPTGYLQLSAEGNIAELNFAAAGILNKERAKLMGMRFAQFVEPGLRTEFYALLQESFSSSTKRSAEFILNPSDDEVLFVLLEFYVPVEQSFCSISIVDIDVRKRAELAITEKKLQMEQLNSHFIGRELMMINLKKEINDLRNQLGLENKYMIFE